MLNSDILFRSITQLIESICPNYDVWCSSWNEISLTKVCYPYYRSTLNWKYKHEVDTKLRFTMGKLLTELVKCSSSVDPLCQNSSWSSPVWACWTEAYFFVCVFIMDMMWTGGGRFDQGGGGVFVGLGHLVRWPSWQTKGGRLKLVGGHLDQGKVTVLVGGHLERGKVAVLVGGRLGRWRKWIKVNPRQPFLWNRCQLHRPL